MRFAQRLPIGTQFLLLLAALIAIGGLCTVVLARAIFVMQATDEARTVADMVDNVGEWSSQYRGIWVRADPARAGQVGDFLESDTVAALAHPAGAALAAPATGARADGPPRAGAGAASAGPAGSGAAANSATADKERIYHKNPALVQRELSDVTQASRARAKFRMTSDKYMNPNNAPTRFELQAIDALRSSQDANEYTVIDGRNLRYARSLIARPACMGCHDTPEKAPPAVRTKYPDLRGYGYKPGEKVGVISVVVPLDYAPQKLLAGLGWRVWALGAAFVACVTMILVYMHRAVIRPMRLLGRYAERAAEAQAGRNIGEVPFAKHMGRSRNEIHHIGAAIAALHAALKRLQRGE